MKDTPDEKYKNVKRKERSGLSLFEKLKTYFDEKKQRKLEEEERQHQETIAYLQKLLDDKRKELEEQGKL